MTPLIRDWVKSYVAAGGDPAAGVWFDISGALHRSDVQAVKLTMMQARPPFDRCYVVCSGKKEHIEHKVQMKVAGSNPQEGIFVNAQVCVGNGPPVGLGHFKYAIRDGVVLLDDGMSNATNMQMIMRALALWYGSLSQGGEGYQPQVKQCYTSKRLQAKGKAPLYSWHTVKVEPPKPKQEHQGGTHASPRLHDRRGHLRRLKNGKTCWVKPCKVGDASKGAVFKDYEVGAT